MTKILTASFAAVLVLTGCLKAKDTGCRYRECQQVAPATEVTAVQNYITTNGITGTVQHCSGAFYKVESAGSGTAPNGCNTVNVTYAGYLTNGTRFDTATAVDFELARLIKAWPELLPKIATGGKIRMFVPPSLGYGSSAAGSIPANSILVFNVTLNSVK